MGGEYFRRQEEKKKGSMYYNRKCPQEGRKTPDEKPRGGGKGGVYHSTKISRLKLRGKKKKIPSPLDLAEGRFNPFPREGIGGKKGEKMPYPKRGERGRIDL